MARVILLLLVPALLALSGRADKTAEEPVSFTKVLENLQRQFENATRVINDATGMKLPANKDEFQTAIQEAYNNVKEGGQKFQKKLAEYNVTESSFSSLLGQLQSQVTATVDDLKKQASPEVAQNIDQMTSHAQTGYNNLVNITKSLHDVVTKNADKASQDLQPTLDEMKNHLTDVVTMFQTKVQEIVAEKKKT